MRPFRRAEFDWRAVFAAVYAAELSDRMLSGGSLNPNPQPCWPTPCYEAVHRELISRLIAPPRHPARRYGLTVEELEEVVGLLMEELRLSPRPLPAVERRWRSAAAWLREAVMRARATRVRPSVFDS